MVLRFGLAFLAAQALGGCALTLPGMGTGVDDAATGSIKPSAARVLTNSLSKDLDEEDTRRAMGALAIAVDPQGNGETVRWDNPQSKASGSFTPVALAYPTAQSVCRVFLARIEAPSASQSIQGTACRDKKGEWAITDTQPWKKS